MTINNFSLVDAGEERSQMLNEGNIMTLNIHENETEVVDPETAEGVPKRPTWGKDIEFLLSCISLSVGFGNLWRFPAKALQNGGSAFMVPYIIVLFLVGKPFYYFEMILGQLTSKASISSLQSTPIMKGVAVGQQIAIYFIMSYYCTIISIALFYLFQSFSAAGLPWAKCDDNWTNCIHSGEFNQEYNRTNVKSSADLYYRKVVTEMSDDLSDGIGTPVWHLVMWLAVAWIIVYFVIIKGIKSSGKVSYFLAIFPYVILVVLLVQSCSLQGAWEGIKFFLTPDLPKIFDSKVWYEAVVQLFFSLTIGMGCIIMYSSYNKFNHNIYRDAMIVSSMDTFSSMLSGVTISAVMGNLGHNIGEKNLTKIVKEGGMGLAFMRYPEALVKFEYGSQVFSVLFFFMLFLLGIGSVVGLQSCIVTNMMDIFPKAKFWKLAGVSSLLSFLIGIVYLTNGGQYILELVDHFAGTFLIFALATFEIIGFFWIYGLENFCWDVEFMLKRHVTVFWRVSWLITVPGFMLVISGFLIKKFEYPNIDGNIFPTEYLIAGWLIFLVGMSQIIMWAIWTGHKKSSWRSLIEPNPKWGPKSPIIRREWLAFKEDKLKKRIATAQANNHSWLKQKVWILLGKYR